MKRRKLITIMSLPIATFATFAAIACSQQPTPTNINAQTIIDSLPSEVKTNIDNQELDKLKEKLQNLGTDLQATFLNLLDETNKQTFTNALKDGYKISKITLATADKSNSVLQIYLSVKKDEDVKNKTIKIVDLKQTKSQTPPSANPGLPKNGNPPETDKPPVNGKPPKTDKPPTQGTPPKTDKPPETGNPPDNQKPPENTKPPETGNPPASTKPPAETPEPPTTVTPPPLNITQPPSGNPVQSPKPPEHYVQKFETDLKKFQGYEIKTEISSSYPEENDYLFDLSAKSDSKTRSSEWKAQNGGMVGKLKGEDFLKPIANLDAPEWNPNKNTFNSAKEQRDELLQNKFEMNPRQVFSSSYNFWYNQKIIANRNFAEITSGSTNLDNVASAPQPLKPSEEIKNKAVNMNSSDLKLNLESLKYLVNNNEMGQNPKMLGWKLITLSDDIRLNKKSVLSDHIFENELTEQEKNLKLFQGNATDVSNVKFYADEISNKTGTMTLYVTYKKGTADKAFKIDLDKTNVDLKNDYDYIKFLNDRSVSLSWSYGGWFSESDEWNDEVNDTWKGVKSRLDKNIKTFHELPQTVQSQKVGSYFGRNPGALGYSNEFSSGGTAWVVDKIIDETLPKGQHAFVVATNKHVLDIGQIAGTEKAYGFLGFQFTGNVFKQDPIEKWAKNHPYYKDYEGINEKNYETMLANDPQKDVKIQTFKGRLEFIKRTDENSRKAMNKTNSWLRNSGFYSFTWTRYETDDYSKTNHIASSDLVPKNGYDSEPYSEEAGYPYRDQIVTNHWKFPARNVVGFSNPMFKDGDKRKQLNATDNDPTWITDTRRKFIDSIIYLPQYTLGHVYRTSGEQANSGFGGGLKREETYGEYTHSLLGPDLVLVKMVFNDEDLRQGWPALYQTLQKSEEEQKKWFKALDLNPRTDDRTNSYMAGYPATNIANGIRRIFSYRAADKSATSSMRSTFVVSGTGNNAQKFFRDWDADIYNKYYAPFDVGGKYNEKNFEDYPTSKQISNEKNGLYTITALSATETLYSGDHANPGNSGSMVVDANFRNYGILYAFIPGMGGGPRTAVHNLVQLDPYARSNVLDNQRPNVRLELIEILKKKGIKTLNLNSSDPK
ncbi:proline-rich domain-containing protein [Mycoplasmopsis agassizii]|uniref:DUF31 domain-containing protein n=1 Tax=Mycoplasmopsis agassizii TaxID=33922 RepID=A0ABX4H5K7_9BACT|nr:proline-rich domain-containing protein [Mycoplasmopsis agassizii]PAF55180.1 hypothetical protein CJF60_00640 [Mycoplasmopsis agassizii]SMC20305.1 hypothetical protein SAMN02745179_01012 [Mycoplasmopsis agassizii]